MKGIGILTILVLTFISVQGKWEVDFEDNFDGGDLRERWNFEVSCAGGGNNELQCYTDNRPENVRQEEGKLIIQARKESWGNIGSEGRDKEFTSARLNSKFDFLYGKVEIRARMPKGKHLWPAIWMLPTAEVFGGWPRSGEIDIVEYRGQKPNEVMGNLHYGQAWDIKTNVGSGDRVMRHDFSENFHVFGLIRTNTSIEWRIDDKLFHYEKLDRKLWPGLYKHDAEPFDREFYLIINLAVGGGFFGNEQFFSEEARGWAKSTLEIDYVRKFWWNESE